MLSRSRSAPARARVDAGGRLDRDRSSSPPPPRALPRRSCSLASCSSAAFLGGVAGERQEHVVEGRAMQGDVGDRDARVVEPAHRCRAAPSGPRRPDRDTDRCRPRRPRVGSPVPTPCDVSRRPRPRSRPPTWSSSTSPPIWSLSSSDVPSAITRPEVDHRDPVGELVGLLEVLGGQQHRGALAGRARGSAPTGSIRLRGSRPGGGLVQEQHLGAGRPGSRRRRGGAACRRSRSWRAGGPASASSKRSRTSLRALPGLGAGEVVQPSHHLEVLEAGQVLVDRRELPGQADHGAERPRRRAPRRARRPRPVPSSGCRRVVRIRIAVVLPAPLGPSRPKTVPCSHRRGRRP